MGMATPNGELIPAKIQWHMIPKLRRWFLEDDAKLVRIKSLKPFWGPYGLEWPVLLVDYLGNRWTQSPVWCRRRLIAPWRTIVEPERWKSWPDTSTDYS